MWKPWTINVEWRYRTAPGGIIVEDGTHAEFSQAGGVYESPWDRQAGAFLDTE